MQFFYSSKEPIAPKEGETEVSFHTFKHSFNTDCVIRTVEYSPGRISVLLNDGHEEAQERAVEKRNGTGKVTGTEVKRERVWLVSQIQLTEEDTQRYWKMFTS